MLSHRTPEPQTIIRLLFFATILLNAPVVVATQPNIVFILSDDQAWTDYGFMGHPVIETPHLDRLAEQSLAFDHGS